jgi:hypothetical protein
MSLFGFIGGGAGHFTLGDYSLICGGNSNVVLATYGSIVGGETNKAGDHSFVGGGKLNDALGSFSVIGGGSSNSIDTTSVSAAILSGTSNSIVSGIGTATNSAIVGGSGNSIASGGGDVSRCVILGGTGLTTIAAQTDTAYVPRLNSAAGRQAKIVATAVTYALTLDDHFLTVNNPGPGNITIDLPGVPINGQEYYIKSIAIIAGDNLNATAPNAAIINNTGANVTFIALAVGIPIHVIWSAADGAWMLL